ncbi:MAG: hypothetical protein HY815_01960 [Candidatus Riflebacteria bacterium]|nr:hypothetical protein [Candidatus Riflebacteria bacterium]
MPLSRVVLLGSLALALAVGGTAPAVALQIKGHEREGMFAVRKGFRFTGVDVEGNSGMFLANNRQFGAQALEVGGRFEQTLRVDVDMEVMPRLSVRGRFDDTLWPAKQELAVDYHGEALTVSGGDIVASFAGAEFPMESQNLFGVRGRYRTGKHDVTAVAAKLAGNAGHFEGQGDNTKGPYFLADRKVVSNSEKVYVDGIRKFRGTDYSIDYASGVLNFTGAVDDRFKITVDYEFEAPDGLLGQSLVLSRYTGELSDRTNLGVSVGSRRVGGGGDRDLVGFDGRLSFASGVSLGGEVAFARADSEVAGAFRGEASGLVKGVSWNLGARMVEPAYSGLGAVTARKDVADLNLGLGYTAFKNARLSTRLATSRDNLSGTKLGSTQRDLVVENTVVYALPAGTRMELSLDNRNEFHWDDLEEHLLDSQSISYRTGLRYRLDRHMMMGSYEIRNGLDRGAGAERELTTHVASTQLQSRLFKTVFSTATLQFLRGVESPSGRVLNEELLTGVDLTVPLFRYMGSSTSYTLQQRLEGVESKTHSAVLSLRTQNLGNFSGEASLQMKRTDQSHGDPVGNSLVTGRASYQIGPTAFFSADYQRRLTGASVTGPVTLDLRGSLKPLKGWDLGGGYKIDQFEDPNRSNSYFGRVAYMEATVNF